MRTTGNATAHAAIHAPGQSDTHSDPAARKVAMPEMTSLLRAAASGTLAGDARKPLRQR